MIHRDETVGEHKKPHSAIDPDERRRILGYARLLSARFPHLQSVSLQLLERYAPFRELCEEYATCAEVLERLADSPADNPMRREYTALNLRIEGELLRYIGDHGYRGD